MPLLSSLTSFLSSLLAPLRWLYDEFGLASLFETGRDAWLVILARTCRMFAYGASSLVIALFFAKLGFTDFQIGLFMTMTLIGDVVLSFGITMVADKMGRRRVLMLGACLMVGSGLTFAVAENFWILLFAAIVGIISATGGDFGPFRAVEESTLAHLTVPRTRSDVLSWYVTTSSLGSALGTEFAGRAVDHLRDLDGWDILDAYHAMFWLYIVMGCSSLACALVMSDKCEIAEKQTEEKTEASEGLLEGRQGTEGEAGDESDGEEAAHRDERNEANANENSAPSSSSPRRQNRVAQEQKTATTGESNKKKSSSRFAQISVATRKIMYKLWFLLTVDSLADGMVSYALTNYYLSLKFPEVSKSRLGDIMSASYLLASCSTVLAGPLAKRLGLINTMVFTHLPSSTAVLLFPAPRSLGLTVTLLLVRTGLNNMDQAPRAAFIAAVVRPEERTAVMGITSLLRTLASTVGPSITGALAGDDRFWIAYVAAGALRIAYDVGLFALFVNMKLHAHEPELENARDGSGESRRKSKNKNRNKKTRTKTRAVGGSGAAYSMVDGDEDGDGDMDVEGRGQEMTELQPVRRGET